MMMNKYVLFPLFILAFLIESCDKKVDFIYLNRKQVPAKLQLTTVKNEEMTLEKYQYDEQGRLSVAMIRGADTYRFLYQTNTDTLAYQVNEVKLGYDGDQLVQVSSQNVSTELRFGPDRIFITQIRKNPVKTVVKPDSKDTLVIQLNENKQITRTTLMPVGTGLQFSFDSNVTPYTHIRHQMLSMLLLYPLEEVSPQLVMLLCNKNLLRYHQLSPGQVEGVESLKTADMSYRFDQAQYDVPTYMEIFGSKPEKRYYHYELKK